MPGTGPGYVAYAAAMRCLDQALGAVVAEVCLWDRAATAWALRQGLPGTDGPALLRVGLQILARHYRGV